MTRVKIHRGAAGVRQTTRVSERRLAKLAVFGELSRLPELIDKRRRLVSTRNRRRLADGLRRTAAAEQPPRRFDCCPVLADRVAAARYDLLLLADALEHATDPDPASVALVRELLTSGCSPLYNVNLPADDLHAKLAHASARIGAGLPADRSPTRHARRSTESHLNTQLESPGAVTRTTSDAGQGVPWHSRKRTTDHQRRALLKWLRRTANHTDRSHRFRRHALLSDRAAGVRSELLQIAAMLEHTHDPNPTSVIELHQLLTDHSNSPSTTPIFTSQSSAQPCTTCAQDSLPRTGSDACREPAVE